jgi:tricarballylate dehydrogenase
MVPRYSAVPTAIPEDGSYWEVVVIGHGAAGLTAALAHLEDAPTARVAILDKATRERRGGSTAWTTAALRLDKDAQLDPEWGDIVPRTAGHHANEAYIDAFYENATETLNWIRGHGVEITKRATPIPLRFGNHTWSPVGGGRAIVDTLGERLVERGAAVFYETTARRLLTDANSRITGVVINAADGTERTLWAGIVILASGGFEANPEMLSRYIPNAHRLRTVSPGTDVNTGDGIRMAVEIGAATAGQFDGVHLEPVDPRSSNREGVVGSWLYGIAVDAQGERFVDEAEYPFDVQFDQVANRMFREHDGVGFAIIDASIRRAAPAIAYMNDAENAPVRADSIEGLAEKLGIPVENLSRTVSEYNAACQPGTFDPTTFDTKCTARLTPPKSHWAQPLTTPPFEGVPMVASICFTYGGLRTDGAARVLNMDGRPIGGLYAAGEITGVFYEIYPAATSVLRSLTFGRIAGQTSAREHLPDAREHLVDQ